MNTEDSTEEPRADFLPTVCPGCDGQWGTVDQSASTDVLCLRCGLSQQEALTLLWEEISTAYATAYTSAISGNVAEARRLLRPFLSSPLAGEFLPSLDALCAHISGDWEPMPGDGEKEVLAYADYKAAHTVAQAGDLPAALLLIERCLTLIPYLLPAQKLRMLLLAGTGRAAEAEALRVEMARFFSSEPDIAAWRFAESPRIEQPNVTVSSSDIIEKTPTPVSRRRQRRPAERPFVRKMRTRTRQNSWGRFTLPIALAALCLAAVSLTMSLRRFHSTQELAVVPVTPTPASPSNLLPSVLEKGTGSPSVTSKNKNSEELTVDLQREWKTRRQETDLAQARRWFNRAVRAKAHGDWQECDRLAAAAAFLGKNSYLHDESLVLRALAADNRGSSTSVRIARYNAIVEETPHSAYAPWARRVVARLSIPQEQLDPRSRAERNAANDPDTVSEQGIR